jgi:hypothetical protein
MINTLMDIAIFFYECQLKLATVIYEFYENELFMNVNIFIVKFFYIPINYYLL